MQGTANRTHQILVEFLLCPRHKARLNLPLSELEEVGRGWREMELSRAVETNFEGLMCCLSKKHKLLFIDDRESSKHFELIFIE